MGIEMYNRIIRLPEKHSFFLFGARGVGKSTLLESIYGQEAILLDLLDPTVEDKFARNPGTLKELLPTARSNRIIIDEIQKLPKLLDLVHWAIEKYPTIQFILTGSSARKLRYGAANLLAGRAFFYHLYPFSYLELGEDFILEQALSWGLLPHIFSLSSAQEKTDFLIAYTLMYLKEEVWAEHLIRKLEPFRKFLEVSAQMNGKIINYANIAYDIGVDEKTVKEYFILLEDTLLGFFLEPYHTSIRKRVSKKPKFYYFDVGVTRALANTLNIPLRSKTSYYGEVFEHFIIQECWKLINYFKKDWRFFYLQTKDNAEIDLIIERPGLPLLCIEIKSTQEIHGKDLTTFLALIEDLAECEAVCFSQDPYPKKIGKINAYHWQEGIKQYFWM